MMFEKAYQQLNFKPMHVTLKGLPASFENFNIAHLSDLHVKASTPLDALTHLVNSLNALPLDMVALTGDLIDTQPQKIEAHLAILKQLKHPVYFVSGNHDLLFARQTLKQIIETLGFHMLDNRIVLLTKGNATLQLIGFGDAFSKYFGIKREEHELLKKLNPDYTTVLLAHQPKDFSLTKNSPITLQLSGHTHGGQIYPFGYVVRLFQPFVKGLHQKDTRQIYVTTGYGSWGVKMRFLVPSEIPLITLKRVDDAQH